MFKLQMEKMEKVTDWINFCSEMEILKNQTNARNENTEKGINNGIIYRFGIVKERICDLQVHDTNLIENKKKH